MAGVTRISIQKRWDGDIVKVCCNKFVSDLPYNIGLAVMRKAKELAPKNYGQLAASIMVKTMTQSSGMESPSKYQVNASLPSEKIPVMKEIQPPTSPNVALVGTALEHGWYTEYGTVPHLIKVKDAKVLAKEVANGKWVYFGKEVYHPGTDPQPFLRPAKAMVADGEVLEIVKIGAKKHFLGYLYEHEVYLREWEANQFSGVK